MANIDEQKLEVYVKKLYNGELKRFKERQKTDDSLTALMFFKQESKRERINPSDPQKRAVRKRYGNACAICGRPYEHYGFKYHHINGNPSDTVTSNLILVCQSCHDRIHDEVRAKLKDYKIKSKRKSQIKGRKGRGKSPFDLGVDLKSDKLF